MIFVIWVLRGRILAVLGLELNIFSSPHFLPARMKRYFTLGDVPGSTTRGWSITVVPERNLTV